MPSASAPTRGAGDLVDVPALQATSYTLPDLPADQTFVARLFTRQADRWSASEVAFKAPQLAAAARFVAPLNGQLAVTSARIFQWTAGARPGLQLHPRHPARRRRCRRQRRHAAHDLDSPRRCHPTVASTPG